MNKLLATLLITLVVAGCATKQSYENKLRKRVQVGMYDSLPRVSSDHVDVFDEGQTVQRPYKEIALLNCEGTRAEEAAMTGAIIYRAQMIGANAVIILPPFHSGWGDRRVYRAKAVIYETPDKN